MAIPKDQESAIHNRCWNALIEATPEWWQAAQLTVNWVGSDSLVERFDHVIESPEGHREPVSATDEMTGAILDLADLYRRHGAKWTVVVYRVEQESDSADWKCSVDFSY